MADGIRDVLRAGPGGDGSGSRRADPQDGEGVRERVGGVPDHEDGAAAEDAEDGLQEARPVVGVKVRGCFVGQQT